MHKYEYLWMSDADICDGLHSEYLYDGIVLIILLSLPKIKRWMPGKDKYTQNKIEYITVR